MVVNGCIDSVQSINLIIIKVVVTVYIIIIS